MRAWLARLFGGAPAVPLRAARWVVVDCETSGLDPARDRLLSVGAVAVRGARVVLDEAFSAVLRQDAPRAAADVLVHGIGADAQRSGSPVAEALSEFSAFLGDGLPVAFHAPFDAAVLRRAIAGFDPRWLDLARLAPALHPDRARERRSLDDWLQAFEIPSPSRHDALADAYATAQLLLVLLADAERQGIGTVDGLRRLERSGRWTGAA